MNLGSLTVRQLRALLDLYGGPDTDAVDYALMLVAQDIAAISDATTERAGATS